MMLDPSPLILSRTRGSHMIRATFDLRQFDGFFGRQDC